MTGRLDGKVAIVTGASRGIGRAIAQAFVAEGAKVAVLGRTVDGLHETVRLCAGLSGTALAFACDVRREDDIAAAVASVKQTWGRIDILVNNAGMDDDTPFLEVDRATWRDIIDTNLTSVFIFSQEVARVMKEQGGGVILHTASIDGSGGDGPFAAYNSSKAGLLGLNRTMALELAAYGIRSNCVSPGFTKTDMTAAAAGPELMHYLETSFDRVPMRRLVQPEEVAAAFVFLASNESSAITGIDLRVDAGLTANWYILETLPKGQQS
jgi:NAD(P)-dependent dehydrogenase (short-subunit alcohol dehydrogenase family)